MALSSLEVSLKKNADAARGFDIEVIAAPLTTPQDPIDQFNLVFRNRVDALRTNSDRRAAAAAEGHGTLGTNNLGDCGEALLNAVMAGDAQTRWRLSHCTSTSDSLSSGCSACCCRMNPKRSSQKLSGGSIRKPSWTLQFPQASANKVAAMLEVFHRFLVTVGREPLLRSLATRRRLAPFAAAVVWPHELEEAVAQIMKLTIEQTIKAQCELGLRLASSVPIRTYEVWCIRVGDISGHESVRLDIYPRRRDGVRKTLRSSPDHVWPRRWLQQQLWRRIIPTARRLLDTVTIIRSRQLRPDSARFDVASQGDWTVPGFCPSGGASARATVQADARQSVPCGLARRALGNSPAPGSRKNC